MCLKNSVSDPDPVGSVSLARIRIRFRKRWSGSGYQKNRDKLAYKSTKIIKIYFFKINHLFCLLYANITLKITKKKHVLNLNTKKIQENIGICSIQNRARIRFHHKRIRFHHPGSGSADPDPHQNDTDPKHCLLYLEQPGLREVVSLYSKLFAKFRVGLSVGARLGGRTAHSGQHQRGLEHTKIQI